MNDDGTQSRRSSGATLLSDVVSKIPARQKGCPVWLALSIISATVGSSTQFGYNSGVIAVPAQEMRAFYNASHFERTNGHLNDTSHTWLWSSTVSLYCIGALFGALAGSFFANKLGRKGALLFSNVFSFTAYLFLALSKLTNFYELVLVGRLIAGFHTGLINAVVPLYLAEIAPTFLRGSVGLLHPLLLVSGILGAQITGFYLFNGDHDWPVLLCLPPALASAFQLATLPFCPESPRWLYMTKKDTDGARLALKRLRNSKDVDNELNQMEEEMRKENCGQQRLGVAGFLHMVIFRRPHWRLPCLISCALCIGLQMSGINIVWYYIPDICKRANFTESQTALVTVILGTLNIVGTVFSSVFVDRFGRRPLTIIPSFVLSFCCLGITFTMKFQSEILWLQWVCVGFIAILVLSLSGGPGPMVYVIGSEIWPQDPRPAALSLSNIFNWSTNFLLGMFYPYLVTVIGEFVFLIFAATMFILGVFYFYYLPETRNKTFEEIAAIFKGNTTTPFYIDDSLKDLHTFGEMEYPEIKFTEV